jgi:uncharacterized membrane-anchored protein
MNNAQNKQIARDMMSLHGLRAQAIAQERLVESRIQGDAAGMERWQAVGMAIAELRQPTFRQRRSA